MAKKRKPGIIIEYPDGQNLFEINAQDEHIAKYQSEFLNIVNKHGHGNDAAIVGMVSQVIKDYRKNSDSLSLDGWKEYHQQLTNIKGIEFGVEKNWAQFQEMKKAIDAIDKDVLRYWLKNLVYNKTFAGLQAQDMVLKDIARRLSETRGHEYGYCNGDADDERAQIDGYIINPDHEFCGLQVKSESYKSHNTVERNAPVKYVYYKLNPYGLSYDLNLDSLVFVEKKQYEEAKEAAKEAEQQKIAKTEERKKRKEKKACRKAVKEKRLVERKSKIKELPLEE